MQNTILPAVFALYRLGRFDAAVASLRRAIEIGRDFSYSEVTNKMSTFQFREYNESRNAIISVREVIESEEPNTDPMARVFFREAQVWTEKIDQLIEDGNR